MSERGRGASYRQPSLLERAASTIGGRMPRRMRRAAEAGYRRLLGVVQDERLIAHLPHGERVRLLPQHRGMTWNRQEYEAFRADVRPGDTVLDVGANIGAYSVLFAVWVGQHGHVVAFEPAPEPYRALQDVLRRNDVADRVTALQQAVSAAEGVGSFAADGVDGANRLSSRGTVEVRTTSIDAVCRRLALRPGLIKIDAEGAELDVLRGARRTIAAAGPDLRLYVEMHPHLWAQFGASLEALESELAVQGLRAERLDGKPDVWNLEGVCLRVVPCAS